MDYEKVLQKIGEFGRWQKKSLLFLLVPIFVAGIVYNKGSILRPKDVSCNIHCQKFVTPSGIPITKKQAFSSQSPVDNNSSDLLGKPNY